MKTQKMDFETWMARVDAILERKCGMDSRDLADFCYRDRYDDGVSPAAAAREAVKSQE